MIPPQAWLPGPDGRGLDQCQAPLLFSPIVPAFFQYLVPDPAGSNTRYGVPALPGRPVPASPAPVRSVPPGPAGAPAGTPAANDGRVFPGRPAGALPAHCYPPLGLPTAATEAPRPWTTPPSATGSMLRRPFTPGKVVDNSATNRLLRRDRYALRLCFWRLFETARRWFLNETAAQTLQNTTASCAGQRPWITGQA